MKIKDDKTDEVLAVDELDVIEILKNYQHRVYKKNFTGISNEKEYFNVIELFKN